MTAPKLATTTKDGRRVYRDNLPPCQLLADLGYDHQPDLIYPSVTTVIGNGIPKKVLYLDADDQPITVIDKWGVKAAAEYAVDHYGDWSDLGRDEAVKLIKTAPDRVRDSAARRGTDVHDVVYNLALGQVVPTVSDDFMPWIRSARQFVAEFRPKVIWSETTVFNRMYVYAGSLDLIAYLPGYGLFMIDFKTGSLVYGSTGVQLAGYLNCEYGIVAGQRQPMHDWIQGGLIVNLTEDGYSVVPVECGNKEFNAFLAAMKVADHNAEADRLLGVPLRPVHLTGDDLQLVKAWLHRRIQVMVEQHPAAAQRLAAAWPEDVPTIGKPDHTAYELHQIEVVVDRVEAAHQIPFGEPCPATAEQQAPIKGNRKQPTGKEQAA